jgi:uncharacterized DUF497 family protein
MEFRWNEWNVEHIGVHGVSPAAAETTVRNAARPFPRKSGEDKWLVWGRDESGRCLQVVFVWDDDESIFVIHARPLTKREKRRFRRRKR